MPTPRPAPIAAPISALPNTRPTTTPSSVPHRIPAGIARLPQSGNPCLGAEPPSSVIKGLAGGAASESLVDRETLHRRAQRALHERHVGVAVVIHVEVRAGAIRIQHVDLDQCGPLLLFPVCDGSSYARDCERGNRTARGRQSLRRVTSIK